MNIRTKRWNKPALPKVLATAGITLLLMTPLTASANHERHDVVEVLAGAAVAYLIIDSLDHNKRYYRPHRDHYAYERHYKRHHHDRHHKRHHHDRHYKSRHHGKYKWQPRQHERHGYEARGDRRYYR